jgi:hypothetical protein
MKTILKFYYPKSRFLIINFQFLIPNKMTNIQRLKFGNWTLKFFIGNWILVIGNFN